MQIPSKYMCFQSPLQGLEIDSKPAPISPYQCLLRKTMPDAVVDRGGNSTIASSLMFSAPLRLRIWSNTFFLLGAWKNFLCFSCNFFMAISNIDTSSTKYYTHCTKTVRGRWAYSHLQFPFAWRPISQLAKNWEGSWASNGATPAIRLKWSRYCT